MEAIVDSGCILCGADSYTASDSRAGSNSKCWTYWKADCGKSLSSLLHLKDASVKELMTNGPYCLQCSRLVWDIAFTMKQVKTLEGRLRSLKARVEAKIESRWEQLGLVEGEEAQGQDYQQLVVAGGLADTTNSDLNVPNEIEESGDLFAPEDSGCLEEVDDNGNQNNDLVLDPQVEVKEEPFDMEWQSFSATLIDTASADPDPQNEASPATIATTALANLKQAKRRKKEGKRGNRKKTRRLLTFDSKGKILPEPKLCELCSTVCLSKRELIAHMQRIHPETVLESKKKTGTPRAPRVMSLQITCLVCSAVCQGKNALTLHFSETHPEHVFGCPMFTCASRFKSQFSFESHMKDMHGGIFPVYCEICRLGFPTQEELTQHAEIHNSDNPLTCPHCERVFTNPLDLKHHVPSHNRKFHCTHPGCEKSYAFETSFKAHVKKHDSVCDICGINVDLSCKSTWALHMASHSTDQLIKKFFCDQCPKSYMTADGLKMHLLDTHPKDDATRYPCRICGKQFYRFASQKKHEETHTVEKLHACNTCGKKFRTRDAWRSHDTQMHNPRYDKATRRILEPKSKHRKEAEIQ